MLSFRVRPIYWLADKFGDTNTNISVSAKGISVSATVDIGYIDKIHGYRPKYRHISAKILVIG
jgi:hypothetical protein